MEQYNNWEEQGSTSRIPLPHEDFDQYLTGYNEIGNLFNETLTGLQDLDIPSGFASNSLREQKEEQRTPFHSAKHSRKASGTAIFGFADHNKQLSISGMTDLYRSGKASIDFGKSISPGELLKEYSQHPPSAQLEFNFANDEALRPIILNENDEYEEEEQSNLQTTEKERDYIITNENPKSYKFPPSPSPKLYGNSSLPSKKYDENSKNSHAVNNYSVKYLQALKFQDNSAINYVDDIEPLLDDGSSQIQDNSKVEQQLLSQTTPTQSPFNPNKMYKFVPIPIQNPVIYKKSNDINQQYQQSNLTLKGTYNAYFPPPSPPTLSNGSPEWQSSPEPQSPSPNRAVLRDFNANKFSSPVHPHLRNNKANFYTPQFFSEHDYENSHLETFESPERRPINNEFKGQSSPYHSASLKSSPVKYSTSPIRNSVLTNDDTVDANATITQITPLKNQLPNTPARNNIKLEWSPIISPNARASKDVKKHIQQSSPRRKVKKTSLLPPGELDQYWEGPDEDKIFTCTYRGCGKKFTRRYNVRSHIQTHLSDRPFACSYCPKKFVRQHDLNRHVKGHLEARYCRCPCGKEFARLDAMKKHRERNICIGGTASNTNSCITKPSKKFKEDSMDVMSERLHEEFSSTASDGPPQEFYED